MKRLEEVYQELVVLVAERTALRVQVQELIAENERLQRLVSPASMQRDAQSAASSLDKEALASALDALLASIDSSLESSAEVPGDRSSLEG